MGYHVILSIGSNCGNRLRNVSEATKWLSSLLDSCMVSDIYETPEIHGSGSLYMNAVLSGYTSYSPSELNMVLKQYEIRAGRDENCRSNGLVPMDIDIVIFDGEVIREADYQADFFKIGYSQICQVLPSV